MTIPVEEDPRDIDVVVKADTKLDRDVRHVPLSLTKPQKTKGPSINAKRVIKLEDVSGYCSMSTHLQKSVNSKQSSKSPRKTLFLTDCRLYFVGFSKEATERYKMYLQPSGATRYPEYNDKVTHIVVREDSEKVRR